MGDILGHARCGPQRQILAADLTHQHTPAVALVHLVDPQAGASNSLHFDLARSWAQADGNRDTEAIRNLDAADQLAPQRIRNDPIARDLVLTSIGGPANRCGN